MLKLKSFGTSESNNWLNADLVVLKNSEIEVQFTWPKEWQFAMSNHNTTKPANRRDELRKTTCFEAFFKDPKSNQYFELNLSPTGDWNIYQFQNYRSPQPPSKVEDACLLEFRFQSGSLICKIVLPQVNPDFLISLNAIIEDLNQQKTYWALAHQNDKPDFHNFANFRVKGSI